MAMTNVAIIGKIPGYGSVLDDKNEFGKILLRDVTYIDLIPATYSINMGMIGKDGSDFSNFYKYTSGNTAKSSYNIFKNVIKNLAKYSKDQFKAGIETYAGINGNDAKKLIDYAEEIRKIWAGTTSIRILGANDSTFTETISNNFSDNNSGGRIDNLASRAIDKAMPNLNAAFGNGQDTLIGKLQNMSYSTALDALTSASTQSGLISLLSGKILGVQFATPNVWQNSSYNSTLNLFIKLAAPSGDPVSIYKYITLPILTMMAAGSPITVNGVTYAMPLAWDVRAYGITHFKIGAIAAMTISRGSYETVFNSAKQPLLVDVRLTIVPLMQDFAVQYTGSGTGGIGKTIVTGANSIKNTLTSSGGSGGSGGSGSSGDSGIGGQIKKAFSEMEDLFKEINKRYQDMLKSGENKISGGNKDGSIYGGNGLGVQSPGDEVDGLMGIAYGGPTGITGRDNLMNLAKYPADGKNNSYVKGFANSYTFRI